MIRAVSFDIWGTLLDIEAFFKTISDQIPSRPYGRIIEAYKKAIRLRLEGNFSIEKVATESRKYLAKELEIEDEALARAIVRALEDPKTRALTYQDSFKALSELRKNLKVVALGNVMFWPGIITRHILHMNGILDMFDLTVFSDEIGLQKPSKEIFEYVAKKLDMDIKEVAHVGDSLENDFAGGIIAGVTTFLLNRSFNARVCRIGSEAYVINTLEALPTLVVNLNKK